MDNLHRNLFCSNVMNESHCSSKMGPGTSRKLLKNKRCAKTHGTCIKEAHDSDINTNKYDQQEETNTYNKVLNADLTP